MRLIAPLSLLLISFGVIAVSVPQNDPFSPIDEYVYADYLAKIPTQFVVHRGEKVGEATLNALACRGVAMFEPPIDTCGPDGSRDSVTDPNGIFTPVTTFPEDGKTSADIYTPAYFAITWVAAQPFVWAGVDLIDAGRLVGGLWLGLGAILMFLLMTRMRVPPLLAWGLGVLVIVSPAAYWANAFVSTDAPSLAAGAGIGLLALHVYRWRSSPVWLGLAVVLAIALKFQNIIAVALVAIVLVVLGVRDTAAREPGLPLRRRVLAIAKDRSVAVAFGLMAVAVVAQVAWMAVRASIVYDEAPDLDVEVPLSKTGLLTELLNFLHRTALGEEQEFGAPVMTIVGVVLVMITVGGVLGVLFSGTPGSTRSLIAGSVLFASTAAAPVLAIALNVALGETLEIPPRYGLSILPAFVLCAGWLFSTRKWGPAAIATLAVLLLAASVVAP